MKKEEKLENIQRLALKSLKRHHVVYETTKGIKYKLLKVAYYLSAAVSLFMVFAFIFGRYLSYKASKYNSEELLKKFRPTLLFFSALLVLLVLGIVFMAIKKQLVAAILSVVSLSTQLVALVPQMKNVHLSRAGLHPLYWWRHFLPSVICIVAIIFCAYIVLKAKYIEDRAYQNIIDTLYAQNKDAKDMSEREWKIFLNTYDPRKVEEERIRAKKGIKYEPILLNEEENEEKTLD